MQVRRERDRKRQDCLEEDNAVSFVIWQGHRINE